MANKKFIYRGPTSGVTLREGEGKAAQLREVMLLNGQPVELPPEHPYTKRLVAQGRLTEWIAPKKDQPKASSSGAVSGGSKSDKESVQ